MDDIRERVFKHFGIPTDTEDAPFEIMRKAQYTFMGDKDLDEKMHYNYKAHQELLVKICSGEVLMGMDQDPL